MRILTYNVNGLRSTFDKGFNKIINQLDPDLVFLQETRMKEKDLKFRWDSSYLLYLNAATQAGYSGTAFLTKKEPIGIKFNFADEDDGRSIFVEYKGFYLVGIYSPNSGVSLVKLANRLLFDSAIQKIVGAMDEKKPVILCGDLNVVANDIDSRNDQKRTRPPGFTEVERYSFAKLLTSGEGFVDVFREKYPTLIEYSFYKNRIAKLNNSGIRLDYFIVSRRLMRHVRDVWHCKEYSPSDHVPVCMDIKLKW